MQKVIEYLESIVDNGAETLVKDYCLMIDKEKFDVAVMVNYISPDSMNYKLLLDNNIKIFSVYKKYGFVTKCFNKLYGKYYIPYKTKKIIQDFDPNTIHVNARVLQYILHQCNSGRRVFFTCHSVPSIVFKGRGIEYKAARNFSKCNNFRFIALHNDMKKEIDQLFSVSNTIVVRNGVDFSKFINNRYKKESVRKEFNIPLNSFVIGHVGRMSVVKNHTFLIDVFNQYLKINKQAFLFLVGSGELEKNVKEKIQSLNLTDKVLILSHRDDVYKLLKAMDIFVFPSLYEGIPVSLIEAQVSGLKCICSNKINTDAIISTNTEQLSLKSINEWVMKIHTNNIRGSAYVPMEDYDMKKIIYLLEKLYAGEVV